jgi:lipoprotein NlpD
MRTFAFPPAPRMLAWAAVAAAVVVAGCASRPPVPAPVEARPVPSSSVPARATGAPTTPSPAGASATPRAAAPAAPASPAAPGTAPAAAPTEAADGTPRPGFYAVRPGDTLGRIALDHGQSWRDLARWNGLDNPNLIEVGQQLRVVPPGTEPGAAVARPVTPAGRVESRPLEGRASAASPSPAAPGSTATPPAGAAAPGSGAASQTPASAATAPAARDADEDVAWAWPAGGPLLAGFDESRQAKGLSIGGKAGDPVLAAADGRVVYAGAGLRGYGNLVIVKHNALFLTAYAHNQTLLVKEDQVVRRGQKIAEMGSSESDRVNLHFEIRRQGRPIDPARLLPPR